MNMYENGALGQIQSDGSLEGGDSTAFTGYAIYMTDNNHKMSARDFVKFFEVSFGAYVRHPDSRKTNNGFGAYYENPWRGCISRDQLTGIMCALIKGQEYGAMLRLIIHHAAWLFLFSYNNIRNGVSPKTAKWKFPDPTVFSTWAMELRGFGWFSWIFWPILCVFDIHMLISTLIENADKDNDSISFTGRYLVSREYVPTPTSWLTEYILDKEQLCKELDDYWSGWRQQPEMAKLTRAKIMKWINND